MFPYQLEHIYSYRAQLVAPPEVIGPVPEGIRANFYVAGGEITGPKLRGKLRPVGADWGTIRSDGVLVIDARITLETDDGALVYMHYNGLGDLGADGHEQFLAGKLPPRFTLRTAPVFRTAHPKYQWLHRLFCIGVGEADLEKFTASYDVYAVR
ncbi:MAG: DUF3237 domain-containing protein [Stenotrophobium sp.]